jgi:hypothetical protein
MNLLSNFPSFAQNDRDTAAGIIASMLETVSKLPEDVVEEACQSLKRRHNSPFPPSGGQLYAECEKVLDRHAKLNPRLAPPKAPEASPEERERMKARFADLMRDINARNGIRH